MRELSISKSIDHELNYNIKNEIKKIKEIMKTFLSINVIFFEMNREEVDGRGEEGEYWYWYKTEEKEEGKEVGKEGEEKDEEGEKKDEERKRKKS